jgi:chloramphenicol-sensitive protein RarD
MTQTASHSRIGLLAGLGAYAAWGFLPLLFHALDSVPPLELVAWRVIFTVPVCLVFVTARRGWGDLARTLANPRLAGRLLASALFIGANWTIYVTAVVHGHVLATSLGYYINPLMNVAAGTLLLRERLTARQWSAVAIAAAGIALLLAGAVAMVGTALALAGSFALYGLMRKTTPVTAITGLTIETLALLPFAVAWAAITARAPGGSVMTHPGAVRIMIASLGLATAVPLMLFAVAARNLALSTLGFLQFGTPTLIFLIGVVVVGESLDPLRLGCFALIWIAAALFVWDLWQRSRAPA